MLGYFTFATISIGMLAGTCVTIAPLIKDIYDISTMETNFASLIYGIVYVPMNFVSIAVLNKYGLRASVIWGAVLTVVGSWLRLLVSFTNF